MKVYGPYKRKDNRMHVVIVHDDGRKQTKSYPRYLYEQYNDCVLEAHQTIDHINNDFNDNRIENLQVLSLQDNARKQMKLTPRKTYSFMCPNCGVSTIKFLNEVIGNRKKGKRGPYCSRKCAGQATYVNPWKVNQYSATVRCSGSSPPTRTN